VHKHVVTIDQTAAFVALMIMLLVANMRAAVRVSFAAYSCSIVCAVLGLYAATF
jgi:hypothetical protein